MDRSRIIDALRANLLDGGHVVRIRRGDWDAYSGVPLRMSSSLVLLRSIDDFFVDGFVALRIADITDVVREASEKFTEKVLRAEKWLEPPTDAGLVRVEDWAVLLEDVRHSYPAAIVEDEGDGEFLLGTPVRVTDSEIELRYVSSDGVRESPTALITFDRITRVMYGDRYSLLVAKYAT